MRIHEAPERNGTVRWASGKEGKLWWDDLRIEEIGLVNVLRRPGCPVTVRGENGTTYEEGRDYEKIVDPLLLDDLREKLPGLPTVVLAQESTHGFQRDISLEVHVHVVDEVPDKLLHETPPWGARIPTWLSYSPRRNLGARSLQTFSP